MIKLTEHKVNFYEYMIEYFIENHNMPTMRELGHRFGISAKYAHDIVKDMEKDGTIKRSYKGWQYKISNIRVWVQKTDE